MVADAASGVLQGWALRLADDIVSFSYTRVLRGLARLWSGGRRPCDEQYFIAAFIPAIGMSGHVYNGSFRREIRLLVEGDELFCFLFAEGGAPAFHTLYLMTPVIDARRGAAQ